MASAIKKISQIVRLRQVVQRWKARSRRCAALSRSSDDDESSQDFSTNRAKTPSGCVAVLVGTVRRRFVIPTRFLNLPIFVDLLQQTEEEFGFQISGPLILPCEPDFFREVVRCLEEDEERYRGLGLSAFVGLVAEMGLDQSTCKESAATSFSPLLQKPRVFTN